MSKSGRKEKLAYDNPITNAIDELYLDGLSIPEIHTHIIRHFNASISQQTIRRYITEKYSNMDLDAISDGDSIDEICKLIDQAHKLSKDKECQKALFNAKKKLKSFELRNKIITQEIKNAFQDYNNSIDCVQRIKLSKFIDELHANVEQYKTSDKLAKRIKKYKLQKNKLFIKCFKDMVESVDS